MVTEPGEVLIVHDVQRAMAHAEAAALGPLAGGRGSAYPWVGINLLNALVPSDAIAWFRVTADGAELIGFPGERPDVEVAGALLDLVDDHPVIRSYIAVPRRIEPWAPRRMSDLVSDRQLRATRTYAELLRPVDRVRQVSVVSTWEVDGTRISWALNRRRLDFTDLELEVLRQLQPTLALLDRSAATRSEAGGPPAGDRWGLTRREVEVLDGVRRGLTAQAVAHLLGISPRTVHKHLQNTYRKLGCDNRVTALAATCGSATERRFDQRAHGQPRSARGTETIEPTFRRGRSDLLSVSAPTDLARATPAQPSETAATKPARRSVPRAPGR